MNLQFLVLYSKQIINVFIVDFHIRDSNQKLPISRLKNKKESKLKKKKKKEALFANATKNIQV